MRVSQLASETGVPVATIKFYLRERLLHEGELTSQTQARYDQSHVRRLRLVRALLGPGGLSVAATRDLLRHLEEPPESPHDLLGLAHQSVMAPAGEAVDLAPVRELIARWGWQIEDSDDQTPAGLAVALQALRDADFELPQARLDAYAAAMGEVAAAELAEVPSESVEAAVRYVVLGTVLVEPLLLALRRLAQQDASRRRFGGAPD